MTETTGLRLAPLRTVALDGTRWVPPQDLPAERTLVLSPTSSVTSRTSTRGSRTRSRVACRRRPARPEERDVDAMLPALHG